MSNDVINVKFPNIDSDSDNVFNWEVTIGEKRLHIDMNKIVTEVFKSMNLDYKNNSSDNNSSDNKSSDDKSYSSNQQQQAQQGPVNNNSYSSNKSNQQQQQQQQQQHQQQQQQKKQSGLELSTAIATAIATVVKNNTNNNRRQDILDIIEPRQKELRQEIKTKIIKIYEKIQENNQNNRGESNSPNYMTRAVTPINVEIRPNSASSAVSNQHRSIFTMIQNMLSYDLKFKRLESEDHAMQMYMILYIGFDYSHNNSNDIDKMVILVRQYINEYILLELTRNYASNINPINEAKLFYIIENNNNILSLKNIELKNNLNNDTQESIQYFAKNFLEKESPFKIEFCKDVEENMFTDGKIPGDGNCLFNSLIETIDKEKKSKFFGIIQEMQKEDKDDMFKIITDDNKDVRYFIYFYVRFIELLKNEFEESKEERNTMLSITDQHNNERFVHFKKVITLFYNIEEDDNLNTIINKLKKRFVYTKDVYDLIDYNEISSRRSHRTVSDDNNSKSDDDDDEVSNLTENMDLPRIKKLQKYVNDGKTSEYGDSDHIYFYTHFLNIDLYILHIDTGFKKHCEVLQFFPDYILEKKDNRDNKGSIHYFEFTQHIKKNENADHYNYLAKRDHFTDDDILLFFKVQDRNSFIEEIDLKNEDGYDSDGDENTYGNVSVVSNDTSDEE